VPYNLGVNSGDTLPARRSPPLAEHQHGAHGRPVGRLLIVLALSAILFAVQVVGGIVTGSLALLADAGHLLTDTTGLGLALLAIWFARRPASPRNTFGYYRLEILAALANGLLLLAVAAFILVEAWERLNSPRDVQALPMLALAGLAANLVGVRLLHAEAHHSLNMQGAFLEVVSDALASVGVVAAAVIIQLTGWTVVDPLFSVGIALFIVPRTVRLLMAAVHVLLEATPTHIDVAAIEESLGQVAGVERVHDLHVWTITSGFVAMSGHAILNGRRDPGEVLAALRSVLADEFAITHSTIQLERRTPDGEELCADQSCVTPVLERASAR
jgi:cobalt-zinc-cadmium efflux system protein